MTNYHPISILPVLSKIYEKVIYAQTYEYLESNEIMCHNQYGFRKNHSCQHAILKLTHDILDSLNKKNYTIATLIDLSKAFDTISHSTLFKKLHYYGFSESALNWFRSYFDQQAQQIKLNSQFSNALSQLWGWSGYLPRTTDFPFTNK